MGRGAAVAKKVLAEESMRSCAYMVFRRVCLPPNDVGAQTTDVFIGAASVTNCSAWFAVGLSECRRGEPAFCPDRFRRLVLVRVFQRR